MTWLEVSIGPNSYASIPSHVLAAIFDEPQDQAPLSTFSQPTVKKPSIFVNANTGETLTKPPLGSNVKYLSEHLWWELYDKRSHHLFYFNPCLKKSVWKKPQNVDIINLVHVQVAGENNLECVLKDIIALEASIDESQLSAIDMGLLDVLEPSGQANATAAGVSNSTPLTPSTPPSGTFRTSSSTTGYSSVPLSPTLTANNNSHRWKHNPTTSPATTNSSGGSVSPPSSSCDYPPVDDSTLKAGKSATAEGEEEVIPVDPVAEPLISSTTTKLTTTPLRLAGLSSASRAVIGGPSSPPPPPHTISMLGSLHLPRELWYSSLDSGIPTDLPYTPATTLSSCCTNEEVEEGISMERDGDDDVDEAPNRFHAPLPGSGSNTVNSSTTSAGLGDSASCPLHRKTLRLLTTMTFTEKLAMGQEDEDNEDEDADHPEDSPPADPWVLRDNVTLRKSRNTSEWMHSRHTTANVEVTKATLARLSQSSTVTHGSSSLLMETMMSSPSVNTLHDHPNNNLDSTATSDIFDMSEEMLSKTPVPPSHQPVQVDNNTDDVSKNKPSSTTMTHSKRSESCRTATTTSTLPFLSHLRRRKTSTTPEERPQQQRQQQCQQRATVPSRTLPNSPVHTSHPISSTSSTSGNPPIHSTPATFLKIVSATAPQGLQRVEVQPCWHRSLLRSDQTMRKLLTWSKEPLSAPILVQTKKSTRKSACEVFRLIQMYMGDRKSNSGGRKSTAGDVEVLQQVLDRGLHNDNLRDEILVQLCKQTTRNPDRNSLCLGWELMCLCLCYWSPSAVIQPYLLGYVLTNQQHRVRHKEDTSGEPPHEGSGSLITAYALAAEERVLFRYQSEVGAAASGPLIGDTVSGNTGSGTQPRLRPSRSVGSPVVGEVNVEELMLMRRYLPHLRPFRCSLEQCMSLPAPGVSPTVDSFEGVPWILPFLLRLIVHLNGLNTEGLFRNSGDLDAVSQLRRYCEKVLCPPAQSSSPSRPHSRIELPAEAIELCHNDPDVPANVLKQWLRELCPPLLSPLHSLERMRGAPLSCEQLCALLKDGNSSVARDLLHSDDKTDDIQLVDDDDSSLPQLSLLQRHTLVVLLAFLKVVSSPPYVVKNRMQVGNLAIVLAPNLFYPCCHVGQCGQTGEKPFQLHEMERHKAIVELLLSHADTSGVDLLPVLAGPVDSLDKGESSSSCT